MILKKSWLASMLCLGLAMALPGCSQWQKHQHACACKKLLRNPSRVAHSPLYKIINCEPEFTTLAKAIRKAHLKDTFLERGAYYTFFAPTNAAFAKVPPAKLATLLKSENRQALHHLLFYHAIPHAIVIDPRHPVLWERTANGQKVQLSTGDGKILTINGIRVMAGPIMVDNAAIYTIDQVLTPPAK